MKIEYLKYYIGQECIRGSDVTKISAYLIEFPDNSVSVTPILRPLRDMTEEERKERESLMFVQQASPVHSHLGVLVETPASFHYLLSRGFDLFGLIDSGEAINRTTLKDKV